MVEAAADPENVVITRILDKDFRALVFSILKIDLFLIKNNKDGGIRKDQQQFIEINEQTLREY